SWLFIRPPTGATHNVSCARGSCDMPFLAPQILQLQGNCDERRLERSIVNLLNKNSFPTLWIVFLDAKSSRSFLPTKASFTIHSGVRTTKH
ncbi:hypothetical protein PQR05_16645, partial [Paraburkholderia sediminicola]|uniref:hypothetical protein n=1 Tax=Paraburkholderia sediminicola TaxID=458836 RepID=UPI0038B7CF94